jgi:hypothetical protein
LQASGWQLGSLKLSHAYIIGVRPIAVPDKNDTLAFNVMTLAFPA